MYLGIQARVIATLLAATPMQAGSTGQSEASGGSSDEWLIRPSGLGRQRASGPPSFMPELRALYPEALVSLEGAFPGGRRGIARDRYFAFSVGGEELFRTSCHCRVGDNGELIVLGSGRRLQGEDGVWVRPVAVSPRYRTARGIGVGDKVKALVRAYRASSPLYYFSSFVDDREGADQEYVCFLSSNSGGKARRNTVETIRFYVRPAPGKLFAGGGGRFDEIDGTTRVDPEAVIVAIEPNVPCHPGHVDLDP